jgi:integrase
LSGRGEGALAGGTSGFVDSRPCPALAETAPRRSRDDAPTAATMPADHPRYVHHPATFSRALIWKPAIKAAGLPEDTTFHDLRHTFASTALANGVPISEVSRWLGHKSITTTVDLYGHLVPEANARARDALDNAFNDAFAARAKT